MAQDLATIKDIATIAAPLTGLIVNTWLKPKLEILIGKWHKESEIDSYVFEQSFQDYLSRSYEKHSFLTSIVFQNQQKKLKDFYVPLKVVSDLKEKTVKVEEYNDDFIPSYQNVLITDTAGMGKSTLLKYLFLSVVEKNKGIPVFIELRKLVASKPILDFLMEEINPLKREISEDVILSLLQRGDFIFFLDGYDEIPSEDREEVTTNLRNFIDRTKENLFVLSSRPEMALTSFADFQMFRIQALEREEAYELIRKYDGYNNLSKQLIERLSDPELSNVEEFLSNPLLTSLLYKSYEHKPSIPFKKHVFYRQVYDSLFENHDLTKEPGFMRQKNCKLDIEDFHKVLRALGFITVKKGQIEFEKDQIISYIEQAKEHCTGISFNSSRLLQDLITTVPLFRQEGDYYRWAHKSIQEYFAAQFICTDTKGKQLDLLSMMSEPEKLTKYINVLDLCYDIDYKSFRRTVIYTIASRFVKFYETSYLSTNYPHISEQALRLRRVFSFGYHVVFLPDGTFDEWRVQRGKAQTKILDPFDAVFDLLQSKSTTPILSFRSAIKGKSAYSQPDSAFIETSDSTLLFLLRKKRDIIIDIEMTEGEKRSAVKVENSPAWDVNSIVVVEDDPSLSINSLDLFEVVNREIQHFFRPILNYERCITIIEGITKEIEEEKHGDFLSDL